MVPFRVLSRTNLAHHPLYSSLNPGLFIRLQTLLHSQKKSTPLESSKSGLFLQNTRSGGTRSGTRPLHRSAKTPLCKSFACHSYANTRDGGATAAPVSASVSPCLCGNPNFVRRLFSHTYKSLFPQSLLFHIHANPPGVWGSPFRIAPSASTLQPVLESEEAGLAAGNYAVEIFVSARSSDAAAGGAVDHADLHEVRLVDFFDGVFFFAEGGGKRADADGAAAVFVEQGEHEVAVDFVEAAFVDAEHGESFLRDGAGDAAGGAHFSKIAGAAQQAVGDARRSAAAAGNFFGAAFVHFDSENFRGAMQDDQQILGLVKIEAMHDAEARAKRGGDESGAGGSADQREVAEWKGMNARAGSLPDDEVEAKIFHRGIEDFFDSGLQAMDFVEKENFLGFEGSEDGGKVAFALEQRAGAGLDGDGQLVGDDLREGGLAEPRGAVKENVVEGFLAAAGGFDGDLDIFFDALLADVFIEALGADAGFDTQIFVDGGTGDDAGGLAFCAGVRHAGKRLTQRAPRAEHGGHGE